MLKKCRCVLLALVGTLLFPMIVCDVEYGFSNSVFSVVLLFALAFLFKKGETLRFDARSKVLGYLAGLVFSALTAFGFSMSKKGSVDYSSLLLWCAILFYGFVFGLACVWIWKRLEKGEKKLASPACEKTTKGFGSILSWIFEWRVCLVAIMLVFWLPCYLGTFPGNFVYDASSEFKQLTDGYRGDFPMLHTVVITRLLSWSFDLTGSYNWGVMVFTVAQMLLLAVMFSHMLFTFYKMGANKVVLGVLFLYCSAFPVIHLLVTCTVRDMMFCGLLTYCIFQIYRLCHSPHEMLSKWYKPIPLAVMLVLTIYSRNNNTGIFLNIALAVICVVLIIIGKKRYLACTLTFAVVVCGLYFAFGAALSSMCQPMKEAQEKASMTVYSQSLIRTYELEGDSFSKEEKAKMKRFFNLDKITYVPECGGSTKSYLKVYTDEDQREFVEFWHEIGKRYPHHYADAILANTMGMWFPGTIIDGYQEMGVKSYDIYDKCYFYYGRNIESPAEKMSLAPNVANWYRDIALIISFEKVPIISMIFSIGTYLWLLLFCLFYNIYRKNTHLYLPIIIMLSYMIITSFAPLVLLRYYAAAFFCLPMVVMFFLQPSLALKHENKEEKSTITETPIEVNV